MISDNGLINFYKKYEENLKSQNLICNCECGKPKFQKISKYPIVQISQNQLKNTKMLQNKYSIFDILKEKNKRIKMLEVGVMAGDFSYEACNLLNIESLHLIDPFNNNDGMATGKSPRFLSDTNYQYVINRFKKYDFVKFYKGMSYDIFPKYFLNLLEEDKMDFIYIDTNHEFNNTYKEIVYASKTIKDDGIIGIDDYTFSFHDPIDSCEVMQAVNYFLQKNKDWHVSYYSIHENGLHNIYLSKTIN